LKNLVKILIIRILNLSLINIILVFVSYLYILVYYFKDLVCTLLLRATLVPGKRL
jgi:hypothetical protein